jgi:hypothetical protein
LKLLSCSWTAEIEEQLQELLQRGSGRAAFDFDNTIVLNDLGEAFMFARALGRDGVPPLPVLRKDFWEELAHPQLNPALLEKLKQLQPHYQNGDYLPFADALLRAYTELCEKDMLAAYRWTKIFFCGLTQSELSQKTIGVLNAELNRAPGFETLPSGLELAVGIKPFQAVFEFIQNLMSAGIQVFIVTASPQPIIQAVSERWNIPPEQVFGMQLNAGAGAILPEIIEPMTCRRGKVERLLQEGIDSLDFAMGDSLNDLDLLEFAETSVFLDRGNARSLERAKQLGALIQPAWKA